MNTTLRARGAQQKSTPEFIPIGCAAIMIDESRKPLYKKVETADFLANPTEAKRYGEKYLRAREATREFEPSLEELVKRQRKPGVCNSLKRRGHE